MVADCFHLQTLIYLPDKETNYTETELKIALNAHICISKVSIDIGMMSFAHRSHVISDIMTALLPYMFSKIQNKC